MNLLFVLEENEKGPSGVVSVVKNKIINWKETDFIYLVLNQKHWAFKEFSKIKRKNFKIIKLNFPTSHEINIYIKNKLNLVILYKILRILFLPIEFFLNIKIFLYLKKIINIHSINVIFSHNGGWPGGILNRLIFYSSINLKLKKIMIIHNFPVKKNLNNFIFLKLNDFFINYLGIKFITVSNICKNILISESKIKKINVIYNGIKNKIFIKNKKKNINKRINICYFGKIQKRKGLNVLLEASNKISSNFDINIYGDGESKYKKDLLKNRKKGNFKLKFFKPVSNITKILYKTDIVILPSIEFESFGMILIEAMRQKIPVICSDSGGMKEIVKNNINGFLFKNKNSDDLKKKMIILINSKKKREEFGKKGYLIFLKKFSNKIFLKKYYNLVNER